MDRIYMCIDLKSFYASVECVERKLDPLKTNLVVADESRTDKTVCLAVSPSLKQYKIGGRARLYEVKQKVKQINYERRKENNYRKFTNKSYLDDELKQHKDYELDFIIAPPRMKYYMDYSTKIYNTYLKYVAPEDIYVYSIDEVFIDITNYLNMYKMKPKELVTKMIRDVYDTTGITATAGIGTNMFLCKVAMDVVAKHMPANEFGVRLAELNEMSYRKLLWNHKPITDIWRVGQGTAEKLARNNMFTMGDVARMSETNEELLYKLFGINAEFLIDHAWGYEPITMDKEKAYKPNTTSLSTGQVLHEPYDYKKAKLIVDEMTDLLVLDLVDKHYVTNQLTLTIGYDVENITNSRLREMYDGEIATDHYGREIPKHSHGTVNLPYKSSSTKLIRKEVLKLFDRIVNPALLVRRVNISANNLIDESKAENQVVHSQMSLFEEDNKNIVEYDEYEEKNERQINRVLLDIKNKYGKNAIVKGMNLMEGGTTIDRNKQVGGHHE